MILRHRPREGILLILLVQSHNSQLRPHNRRFHLHMQTLLPILPKIQYYPTLFLNILPILVHQSDSLVLEVAPRPHLQVNKYMRRLQTTFIKIKPSLHNQGIPLAIPTLTHHDLGILYRQYHKLYQYSQW